MSIHTADASLRSPRQLTVSNVSRLASTEATGHSSRVQAGAGGARVTLEPPRNLGARTRPARRGRRAAYAGTDGQIPRPADGSGRRGARSRGRTGGAQPGVHARSTTLFDLSCGQTAAICDRAGRVTPRGNRDPCLDGRCQRRFTTIEAIEEQFGGARRSCVSLISYFRYMLPRSFSFSQKCSISSVSGMRSNGMVAVHGRS